MEFNKYKLKDLTINGKGEYGIGAPTVKYSPNLYKYLRITDIDDNGFINTNQMKSINDKNEEKYLLKANDIVFARTGNSTGKSYFYNSDDGPLVYAGFLIKFSLDPTKLNPKYLRYYTLTNEYKGWVNQFSIGSTRKNINAKIFGDMVISLPPRYYQDFVVDILDSLENKVKINKQIIANLEELSQTLFKHWFVDFEFPNEEGNPYKSSGGEMIDSELGKIPSNWKIYKLKDIASHKKETFNPKKSEEVTVKHFSLPAYDNEEQAIEEEVNKIKSNKWIINNNCVLFSKMNPDTKRIWLPVIDNKKLNVASSEFVVMESPNNKINSFIYNICLNSQFIDYLKANTTGSTNSRQRVKPTIAVNYKLAIEDSIVKKYSEIITPYMEEMKILRSEIGKLTQLRDTLLPKLMSGEIEIPDDIEVNSDELSI
ncbi:restriction endonuclease subunit S [Staphylococcus hominis]|uniref:restriction endonuclease subunit S n=1 Tax=Staphylococcus hominis TaxID=1290 RepID=UPI002DB7C889|nr:restriction endonuclease subunit S [Staphylococcus hominis]MEB5794016.1 restriction endonuclease subunit S [Staphylococcus hominis]